jgi:hypothetical protein
MQVAYRAKIGQLLRQQDPGLMKAPLHRFLRNPDHRGRLCMSQPLDAEQVESLPHVLREALDRPQNAAAVPADKNRCCRAERKPEEPEELALEGGRVFVKAEGPDKGVPFADVLRRANLPP